MQGLITFLTSYFWFWPSLATSIFVLLCQTLSRIVFFGDSTSDMMIFFLFSSVWHGINLTIFHVFISKAGVLYTETEVLRNANS